MTSKNLVLMLAPLLLSTQAFGVQSKDIQFHGFASQAIIHTSDNRFFGSSDETSFEFTEIGLGSSIAIAPGLHGAIQVGFRAAGDTSEIEDPRLDFAVLDYSRNFEKYDALQAGLRIGRFRNPIGLHNETRDVLASRKSVILPQSIYLDSLGFRDFFLSSDGLLLYTSSFGDNYSWQAEAFVSDPRDNGPGAKGELTGASPGFTPGKLSGDPLIGGRLSVDLSGSLRLAFSGLKYKRDYRAVGAPSATNLGDGKLNFLQTVLSAEYVAERYTISAELMSLELDRSGFPAGQVFSHDPLAGYIRFDYRLNEHVTPYAIYDRFVFERDDPSGDATSAGFGGAIPAHYFYQRDLTLGAHWAISSNWNLFGEYHYVEGTTLLSLLENPNLNGQTPSASGPIGGEKYWTMAAIMIGYNF